MYKRPIYSEVSTRVSGPRRFIQVLAGPRQVGKTTISRQIVDAKILPSHYASADDPSVNGQSWIEQQWQIARMKLKENPSHLGVLLILDEVQKIHNWSESVKKMWDQDTAALNNLKVVLLGSSALLMQHGLTESLAGRFELIYVSHWSYSECADAFGWTVEKFIYFGGYPGAATLIDNEDRWSRYIRESLIETSISKDIMLMTRINKPALLRRVFELGCVYSGQILSYQKMLGQLQDAGNASTLSHYLTLLSGAGMVTGLEKFSQTPVRQKASSPKLQVLNTALMTAQISSSFEVAQADRQLWGRIVESAVGAHLVNETLGTKIEVSYWRDSNKEVDFILSHGSEVLAIEVKSGKSKGVLDGMLAFSGKFNPKKKFLVGDGGLPIKEFLLTNPQDLF